MWWTWHCLLSSCSSVVLVVCDFFWLFRTLGQCQNKFSCFDLKTIVSFVFQWIKIKFSYDIWLIYSVAVWFFISLCNLKVNIYFETKWVTFIILNSISILQNRDNNLPSILVYFKSANANNVLFIQTHLFNFIILYKHIYLILLFYTNTF